MKDLYGINYRVGYREVITVGCEYYFGQLWDGISCGEELLDSGVIFIYQEGHYYEVGFVVIQENDNLCDTLVRVTNISE